MALETKLEEKEKKNLVAYIAGVAVKRVNEWMAYVH